jgi:SAM-dependent methyltransferase
MDVLKSIPPGAVKVRLPLRRHDETCPAGQLAAMAAWHLNGRAVLAGPGDTDAVQYDPAIDLAAAARYRYGHPAYPPELEASLTRATGLDGNGRLLDAGCGPGLLTVRLAHLAGQAAGLDPDAGMLAEGRRAAEDNQVMNIRWVQGLAEDLPAVAPGPWNISRAA